MAILKIPVPPSLGTSTPRATITGVGAFLLNLVRQTHHLVQISRAQVYLVFGHPSALKSLNSPGNVFLLRKTTYLPCCAQAPSPCHPLSRELHHMLGTLIASARGAREGSCSYSFSFFPEDGFGSCPKQLAKMVSEFHLTRHH